MLRMVEIKWTEDFASMCNLFYLYIWWLSIEFVTIYSFHSTCWKIFISEDYSTNLCLWYVLADASVVALANNCLHLQSLGLYYCQNITDRAIYALAHSRVKNKQSVWESVKNRYEEEGLKNLNISQCTALTPPAVQALCDSCPALHTCPGRHSLIISGCLNLTSVHCACAVQAHRATNNVQAH